VSGPDLFPLAVVGSATLAAAATDLWKFKVYNLLTIPTLALGLAASAWLGGWDGLRAGLLGASLGFGVLAVFFAIGGVGAGDVKLLAAVGAWLGPYLTYHVFVASAIAAGLYATALVLLRGGVLAVAAEVATLGRIGGRDRPTIEDEVRRPDRRRRLVPFAAMTCLGFFATMAMAWYRADLARSWPPYERASTVASTSAPSIGEDR